MKAQKGGADYLGVGAVCQTATKSDASVVSMEEMKKICESVSIPVVAIGGIHKDNLSMLENTGVDGIAVVSAIFAAKDIKEAARELFAKVSKIKEK